jgi:hypothetical protein
MASIKLSAIVSAARGKVGGNVFSANKAGAFVRTYVKPTNRNTTAQQNVRSLFGALSSAWRNLTADARTRWNNAAIHYPYMNRLGDMSTYTGQQLYNSLNGNINACFAAPIYQGQLPAILGLPQTPREFGTIVNGITNVDNTAAQIPLTNLFVNNDQFLPANFGLIIEATAPLSPGITAPQKGLFKSICFLGPDTDFTDTDPWDYVYNGYIEVFGRPTAGEKLYIQVKLVSYISGEASVPVRTLASVTGL